MTEVSLLRVPERLGLERTGYHAPVLLPQLYLKCDRAERERANRFTPAARLDARGSWSALEAVR